MKTVEKWSFRTLNKYHEMRWAGFETILLFFSKNKDSKVAGSLCIHSAANNQWYINCVKTSMSATTTIRHRRSISEKLEQLTPVAISSTIKRLYRYSELPEWQQDNDKIITGYIRETKSVKECVKSLFLFHNESINIYSHLVPTITYLVLLVGLADMFLVPQFPNSTMMQSVMIHFFLLGSVLCLGCSSFFHCLKQHSESHCHIWSKVDYMGIIIMITCSIISLLYYGFHDHIFHFKCFTVFTVILGTICTVFALHDKFNSKTFRPFRAMFYVTFGLSGIVPIVTGFWKFGAYEAIRRVQLKYVLLEAMFYIAGAVIYGFRFPEVLAPGKFDFVGHSHQIFHIMVVLGSICHFRAILGSYVFMHTGMHHSSFVFIRWRDMPILYLIYLTILLTRNLHMNSYINTDTRASIRN